MPRWKGHARVKLPGASLLLLTACLTPREQAQHEEAMGPSLREQVVHEIEPMIARVQRDQAEALKAYDIVVDRKITDSEDATEKVLEQAFHTAADGRSELANAQAEAVGRLHGRITSGTDKADAERAATRAEVAALRGRLEAKAENVVAMLAGFNAQIVDAGSLVKQQDRAITGLHGDLARLDALQRDADERRKKERAEDILVVNAQSKARDAQRWADTETMLAKAIGGVASILLLAGGCVAFFRKRSKD